MQEGNGFDKFFTGHVIAEYRVNIGEKEYKGEIIESLRCMAANRSGFPVLGNRVAFQVFYTALTDT